MNSVIEEIYKTKIVHGASGKTHELQAAVDQREGNFLAEQIRQRAGVVRTLEVGCAYGLSSLHICEATRGRAGAHHVIIDPAQSTMWDGVGVANLKKAGLHDFSLMEMGSELAMPQLVEQGQHFDMVFVDGRHTFDQTLLDCYYATRLLRPGGILIVDDVSLTPVGRAVAYMTKFPCYRIAATVINDAPRSLQRKLLSPLTMIFPRTLAQGWIDPALVERIWNIHPISMICLEKTAEDRRRWDWHEVF